MSFKGKPVKVIITGTALEAFEKLKKIVNEEIDNRSFITSAKQELWIVCLFL